MQVKRSLPFVIMLIVAFMGDVAVAVESAAVPIYTDPDSTVLWRTLGSPTETIRWNFPEGASKATLTVEGSGYSRVYADLEAKEQQLDLPAATSAATENVYTLTLAFDDEAETVWTARVGLVQGVNGGASSATCVFRFVSENSKKWTQAQRTNVLEVPADGSTLTYDGQVLDTGLGGAAGWYLLGPLAAGSRTDLKTLTLGEQSAEIACYGDPGLMLLLK